MKLLLKVLTVIITILLTNSTFAIEKSSINLEKNPEVFNTEKNIQQSRLIEMEVVNFKNKLSVIQKKYRLEKDNIINSSLKELNDIIYILRKIQTTRVNKVTADKVIKIVINDLRNINIITKNYLKKVKNSLDKKRIQYNSLSIKLSKSIDKITNVFWRYYKSKKEINNEDKKIIILLQSLQENSNKLKTFEEKKLYNIYDIKKYLIDILKDVRSNIYEIKQNLKNK